MAAPLKDQITADMKAALRAGESDRLTVIRMLKATIQRREVDDRTELDDAGVLSIIQKLVKQGQDSADQFTKGGRPELADKELSEIAILKQYLPAPLSDSELDALIESAITETAAASVKDMGKVMAVVRDKAQGRADMGQVSGRVKARLS